jgi:hypothetical protein
MRDLTELDRYRVKRACLLSDARNGGFLIPPLRIIAASGGGWDHVSVSLETRCPTWAEMSLIHRTFFKPDETAMQLHVPEKDHINTHPFVLHLWRPLSKLRKIPLPPKDYI